MSCFTCIPKECTIFCQEFEQQNKKINITHLKNLSDVRNRSISCGGHKWLLQFLVVNGSRFARQNVYLSILTRLFLATYSITNVVYVEVTTINSSAYRSGGKIIKKYISTTSTLLMW
jgi:hypothetical protein